MKMNERLEQYAQTLGRIEQKADDIADAVGQIQSGCCQRAAQCEARYCTKAEFLPVATKVRGAVWAIVLGFLSAVSALVYKNG